MEDKKNGGRTLEDIKKALQDKVLNKEQERGIIGGKQSGNSTGGIVPQ